MNDFELHPIGTGEELKRLRGFVEYIKGTLGDWECHDYPLGCFCYACKTRARIKVLWLENENG